VDVLPENIGPRINSKYPSLSGFTLTLLDETADDEAFIFVLCILCSGIKEHVCDKSVLFIYI
jgi:hypothetical protein